MKKNANEDCQKLHDNVFRIVIKIRDGLRLHTGFKNIIGNFSGLTFNKLFVTKPGEITKLVRRAKELNANYTPDSFSSYYAINCPTNFDPDDVIKYLQRDNDVELVYGDNGPTIPPYYILNTDVSIYNPGYLFEAPKGINAHYAWGFDGGRGSKQINFIDIEQGWNLNHKDISAQTVRSTGINYHAFRDHGTAVLGVILMQNKKLDRFGIVPEVNSYVISQWRPDGYMNTPDAIMTAITHLNYGDILLLETQAFDSIRSNKALPIEIHEATFQTIKLATASGIIVVESAGNGDLASRVGINLDEYKLNGKRIFNRHSKDFRDSGAIIVAASSATIPHERMPFSNFGSRINCYAWGENVSTTGSYPQSSDSTNTYTNRFSGTSSAAAIITGASISIQSICQTNLNERLSPQQMRNLLSRQSFGTPSVNGTRDKIGFMPDLKKVIEKKFKLK